MVSLHDRIDPEFDDHDPLLAAGVKGVEERAHPLARDQFGCRDPRATGWDR